LAQEKSQAKKKAAQAPTCLHSALAMAQQEIIDTTADMENSHFRSKYVSLGALLKSVRPILAKYGVAMYTRIVPAYTTNEETEEVLNSDGTAITSRIFRHKPERDGHYIRAVIAFGEETEESEVHCPKQTGVHQFASFHTYARRWLLQGLCGVSVDMDDDGNEASGVTDKASGNDRLSHVTTRRNR